MENSGVWTRALVCAVLLSVVYGADVSNSESEEDLSISTRALRDFYPKGPNLTNEKQLCHIGEQCAVRKGARIGKMNQKLNILTIVNRVLD
ncbi:hypothetical protein NHX12_005193 [Muraenolepis orangiensis]|uniref:Uncharacterized protein n=1 Tax=Muraenolepis orangiensis TaxID=630683 RepID=A0A9Q0IC37_9TELE|nr:hypothetical protein NHX12_005193 [Muraenolepis orangiensis]